MTHKDSVNIPFLPECETHFGFISAAGKSYQRWGILDIVGGYSITELQWKRINDQLDHHTQYTFMINGHVIQYGNKNVEEVEHAFAEALKKTK